jgi:hypothetical protein
MKDNYPLNTEPTQFKQGKSVKMIKKTRIVWFRKDLIRLAHQANDLELELPNGADVGALLGSIVADLDCMIKGDYFDE